MRLATAVCALLICSTAAAQTSPLQMFLSLPWSLGISLSQWVTKGNKKEFYVEVTAEGADLEQARQSAFRMAVERALGTVIASETEVNESRIRRDEIITYASGYVADYILVDQTQRGNRTWVKMQVWVSSNNLRDRLLNQSRDSGRVEGGRISTQIESFQHSRHSADRLLNSVLADYPQRAFDIVLGSTRVVIDNNRISYLQVPFSMAWNAQYSRSLAEAIGAINQRSDCGKWFSVCNNVQSIITVGATTAYFDDDVAFNLMHQHMLISRPVIQLIIFDTNGREVFRDCWNLPELTQDQYSSRPFVDLGGGRIVIIPSQRPVPSNIFIALGDLPIKNLDRVDIRAIRQKECSQSR